MCLEPGEVGLVGHWGWLSLSVSLGNHSCFAWICWIGQGGAPQALCIWICVETWVLAWGQVVGADSTAKHQENEHADHVGT